MKLNGPLPIDLKTFFLEGKFDYVRPGRSKEWLLHNFPDPDHMPEVVRDPIWLFGNIEFHFHQDELWMVFSDYLDDLQGGPSLELDRWFLEPGTTKTLVEVQAILNEAGADYQKVTHPSVDLITLKLTSGVELTFGPEDDEAEGVSANEYLLRAFAWKGE